MTLSFLTRRGLAALLAFATMAMMGCAAVGNPGDKIDEAQRLATSKKWAEAYQALESVFDARDSQIILRATELVRAHPEMMAAATRMVSPESYAELRERTGPNTGRDLFAIKLRRYEVFASTQEIQAARMKLEDAAIIERKLTQSQLDAESARKEAEIRMREEARLKHERELAELYRNQIIRRTELERLNDEAREAARFTCRNAVECSKAFSLTQVYIAENSSTKTQFANDTIIETYNPTKDNEIAMRAIRIAGAGTTSTIEFRAHCRLDKADNFNQYELCSNASTAHYKLYTAFIRSRLRN